MTAPVSEAVPMPCICGAEWEHVPYDEWHDEHWKHVEQPIKATKCLFYEFRIWPNIVSAWNDTAEALKSRKATT